MTSYQQFIKKHLSHYTGKGVSLANAMRMVTWDWQYWKMGLIKGEKKLREIADKYAEGKVSQAQVRRWLYLDEEFGNPYDISKKERKRLWKERIVV